MQHAYPSTLSSPRVLSCATSLTCLSLVFLPSASLRCSWCDHAGFRADNDDVYLQSKELDETVARLHIPAYVQADCTNTCTCSTPSATFHRHPHRNAHASCSLFHSQVHPHTPGSRGVGSPSVIWHRKVPPSGLWLCGSASTWQWRAPDTSTFHATPPRNVPHVPTPTVTWVCRHIVSAAATSTAAAWIRQAPGYGAALGQLSCVCSFFPLCACNQWSTFWYIVAGPIFCHSSRRF